MTPQERRDQLVTVAIPLLCEHGGGVSTRTIAEAAGVAEGTIFRVFDSKNELVDAALQRVLDPELFLEAVAAVDPDRPLRAVLIELATLMEQRFTRVFRLTAALGMVSPPGSREALHQGRIRGEQAMVRVLEPQADQITVTPAELVRLLRSLVFSGTHPHLAEGRPLSAEQVVDTLLYGVAVGRRV